MREQNVCNNLRQYVLKYIKVLVTRNVFKKDKRHQIKKGRKYNTRLSTCT